MQTGHKAHSVSGGSVPLREMAVAVEMEFGSPKSRTVTRQGLSLTAYTSVGVSRDVIRTHTPVMMLINVLPNAGRSQAWNF